MNPTKHFKRSLKLNRKHLVKRRRRFVDCEHNVFFKIFAHPVIERPFSSVLGPWR